MSNNYTYPTIVAWHHSSMKYYQDALVALAQSTDAPHNATYPVRDDTGKVIKWNTTDDVVEFETRPDMARLRAIIESEA